MISKFSANYGGAQCPSFLQEGKGSQITDAFHCTKWEVEPEVPKPNLRGKGRKGVPWSFVQVHAPKNRKTKKGAEQELYKPTHLTSEAVTTGMQVTVVQPCHCPTGIVLQRILPSSVFNVVSVPCT